MTRRFAAIWDTHFGFEQRNGHRRPIHDPAAITATLKFLSDFKPHHLVFGGDILDCSMISHHTKGKPRQREGLRLLADAEHCRQEIIVPCLDSCSEAVFITGNHEDWLNDLIDQEPGLEGVIDLQTLIGLQHIKMLPQGGVHRLGKLWFAHGDQIRGGEHVAKAAVTYFNRCIAFGHHHTFQAFTATSAIDNELPKTGLAVPCLCRKDPYYAEGKPNRWAQGFLYGYMDETHFDAQVAIIVRGRCFVNGKAYAG